MSDIVEDRRRLPIFIHSEIDDMTDLTPNDMRVYMHLARRAGTGKAWPSYQSIGDHCFSKVYEHPDTRRKAAIQSVKNLITAKLLSKEERCSEKGEHQSNLYALLDPPLQPDKGVVIHRSLPSDLWIPTVVIHRSPKGSPSESSPSEGSPKKAAEAATTTMAFAEPEKAPGKATAPSLPEKSSAPPLSEVPPQKTEPDVQRLWVKWQSNMAGTLTPVIVDGVNGLLAEYSIAEIEEAISIAVKRGKRTLGYVEGILAKGVFNDKPRPSGGDYRTNNNANHQRATRSTFPTKPVDDGKPLDGYYVDDKGCTRPILDPELVRQMERGKATRDERRRAMEAEFQAAGWDTSKW